MIIIPIHSIEICSDAIKWCNKNILVGAWKLTTRWPNPGFDFQFKDTKDATIFSLKWANT